MSTVMLTTDLVDAGMSDRGGFNRAQVEALGVKWPLKAGWRRGLIGKVVTSEAYQRFLALRKTEPVERVERGWAGHFCSASKCRFRRNTLLTKGSAKIVVSTVGLYAPDDDVFETLDSYGSYFETAAFHADESDFRYSDADVNRAISIKGNRLIDEVDADDDANDMHEAIVSEVIERLRSGDIS